MLYTKNALKILLVINCMITNFGFAQKTEKFPSITYVSKWKLDELLKFKIGDKIIFTESFTKSIPNDIVNGTVYFKNVILNNAKLEVMIEFKDTVVNSLYYSFRVKDDELFKKLGYENKTLIKLKNKEYIQLISEENYTVIISKKRNKINLIKIKHV
ncbi:MAG: hypothetical protein ACSHXL_06140 [Bacteroidota bacterium]